MARAERANLIRKLIDDLYAAKGGGLEQAVTDILNHLGVPAARILRQPHGEEDIRVTHADGTVIISVTASQDDTRPVRWNKAKEILGAGAGLNPVNYVCVGRPDFESLALRSAENIAREAGHRSILLVPIPVLAEAAVRIAEGSLDSRHLVDVLARRRGNLTVDDLSEGSVEGDAEAHKTRARVGHKPWLPTVVMISVAGGSSEQDGKRPYPQLAAQPAAPGPPLPTCRRSERPAPGPAASYTRSPGSSP